MCVNNTLFDNPCTLYSQFKQACAADWQAYCYHPFVQGLADGSLPAACFRYYLQQDGLLLLHFARAYALALVKAESLEEIQAAAHSVNQILDHELALHRQYCQQWGVSEAALFSQEEAPASRAYSRYVLAQGQQGDSLDLYTALAPCTIGYAEIGQRLIRDSATRREGNPYFSWIAAYAGDDCLAMARQQIERLDRLAAGQSPQRRHALMQIFRQATRLEQGFWDMGWQLASL